MKYIIGLWSFTLLLWATSCKKIVSVGAPQNQLTPNLVYNDPNSAIAATSNLYVNLGTVDANFVLQSGSYTDELISAQTYITDYEFTTSALTSDNTSVASTWRNLYSTIYTANAILEGLQPSSSIPDSVRNQCLGEARFMRAWCHFILTNMHGDVPLITSTDVSRNAVAARASSATVYQQIIADLQEAITLLPVTYTGSGEKIRPNRWAAAALLAKAYLFTGDNANAVLQAGSVINSGLYSLLQDLNSVFEANNNEAIWQLWNVYGFTTLSSVPVSGTPEVVVAPALLNAFEPGDNRKSSWTSSATISGTTYIYPNKYKQSAPTTGTLAEYTMYLRLADIYLVRAEAEAQLDQPDDAAADLNMVRHRAGLPNTTSSLKADLLTAIQRERNVELFTEDGGRLFDLRRWNLMNTVLQPLKPLWKSTGDVYPIPKDERLKDPNLTQNPGYDF